MFSSRLKRFIRNNSPLFAVMFLLTVINIATTSYPWAIFPIAGMSIPVLISAAHIFLADDNENATTQEQSRDERRRLRDERRHGHTATDTLPTTVARVAPDDHVAAQMAEAKRYREQMAALIKANPDKKNATRLSDLSRQMDEWLASIQQMADRVGVLKRNTAAQGDKSTVTQAIAKLQQQHTTEADERVRQQLARTLSARQQQLEALDKLDSLRRQSEIQLESTVAALGTIYSQALAAQSTNQVADYSHLSSEVNEQVNSLHDQLEALEEVRLGNIQSPASTE